MIRESIVIACHNGQEYLAETVESAFNQKDVDPSSYEIVLVNDGSTDNTRDIMRYYEGSRLRVVDLAERVGRSAARNAGIQAAAGDIILINDADDLLDPERLLKTRAAFADKKNAILGVLYGDFNVIDELGNVLGTQKSEPFDFERVKQTKLCGIGHSSMAFRRGVWIGTRYDGAYGELGIDDWKFQVDAFKAGHAFLNINETLMSYRLIPKKRDEAQIMKMKEAALA